MALPPKPVWTRVDPWEWIVTVTPASGNERTHRVCKTRFKDRGRKEWFVLDDGHEPWWLAANIADARNEFLLAWNGWKRPFGFADNDVRRPIYGRGDLRRERAVILAEIKAAYRAERKAG